MYDYTRKPGETDYGYKWRIYQAKREGMLEDSWEVIASRMNQVLRPEEPPFDPSVYRKEAATVCGWYHNLFDCAGETVAQGERALLDEIRRERVRLQDERTAAKRTLRAQARAENDLSYMEHLLTTKGEAWYPAERYLDAPEENEGTPLDMVVLLSDWHIGAAWDNPYGKFNSAIAKERLGQLVGEMNDLRHRYRVGRCHVFALGDLISGSIHRTVAVNNRENVIEQVKLAGEMCAGLVYQMSRMFSEVTFMGVCGNHSRIDPKAEALKDERLDALIPWMVRHTLNHIRNVHVFDPEDTSLGSFCIRGKEYLFIHGDVDELTPSGVARLCQMRKSIPYAICAGHDHVSLYTEVGGVKIVRGGALGGSGDDYTVAKRLVGAPSQTVLLCDERGIVKCDPIVLT